MRRISWLPLALFAVVGGVAVAQPSAPPVGSKFGPLMRLDGALQQAHADHAAGRAARVAHGSVGGGTVAVDVTAADGDGAALLGRLRALGLEGATAFGPVVSGRLPVSTLGALAALDGVQGARAVRGVTHARRAGRSAQPAASPVFVGAVTGEASRALRVRDARQRLGVDGSGIRMGILSDSYNQCALGEGEDECATTAAEDIATGDLPDDGARVLEREDGEGFEDFPDGTDEGRAMMQLAYDVAPGVAFSFHTAFGGQAAFAQGIIDLADDGADVVVDDVLLFAEPFFQDGLVAQAVETVVGRGVVYASSAGNQADQSYESDFRPSGRTPNFSATSSTGTVFRVDQGELHDFNSLPGDSNLDPYQAITLGPDESVTIVFQYAEPSFSATGSQDRATTSDYDIYLLDAASPVANVLTGSDSNNNIDPVVRDDGTVVRGSGEPVEVLAYTNESDADETVHLAIVLFSGEARFMKYIDFEGQGTFEYAQRGNSTSVAHNNAAAALNVGAAAWFNTAPFNFNLGPGVPAIINGFSSYGGSRVFFDAAGNAVDNPTDQDRRKPDVVGSDGDNNTFFGFDTGADEDENPNFFGTSAAAPNVAAVAALMLDAAGGPGSLTPAQVYAVLEETAEDFVDEVVLSNGERANLDTEPGYDVRSGFGFVRGDRALGDPRIVSSEAAPPAAALRIASLGPNPARASVALAVETGGAEALTVALYDVLGRRVAVLHDGPVAPGATLDLRADVEGLPAGAYLVRAAGAGRSVARALTVVR